MRLIDADALLKDIEQEYNSDHFPTDRDIMDCVRYAQTIDPVKYAEWVVEQKGRHWVKVCSLCGGRALEMPDTGGWSEVALTKYCPSCGALMKMKVRK